MGYWDGSDHGSYAGLFRLSRMQRKHRPDAYTPAPAGASPAGAASIWFDCLSSANRREKMDLAGRLNFLSQTQCAEMSVDAHRDPRQQLVSLAQTRFHSRELGLEGGDDLTDGRTLNLDPFGSVC